MTTSLRPGSVKICSLREPRHAEWIIAAGADMYGLIFAESFRRVTPAIAAEIVASARERAATAPPLAVGVFVDEEADEINRIAVSAGLDVIQLSGNEPPEFIERLTHPAMKAIRPQPGTTLAEIERLVGRYAEAPVAPFAYLIDGYHPGLAGGSGVRANWTMAAELARQWPIMLAGGLSPENVAEAIEAVAPLAVDVGSGVETEELKDRTKIDAFVKAGRAAFARGSGDGRSQ